MSEFEQFALDLADASGSVIRKYFRADFNVEDKADNSPVTVADRLAETVIRQMINDKYPSHDILGEEHGFKNTGSRWKWVIDPIDGTRSFVSGMPIFGTLISLLENDVQWNRSGKLSYCYTILFQFLNHGFEKEEESLENGIKRHCQQRTCNSSHMFASNQRKNNQRWMNMRCSSHDLGIEEIAFNKVNQ